jgi:hypothetical protein
VRTIPLPFSVLDMLACAPPMRVSAIKELRACERISLAEATRIIDEHLGIPPRPRVQEPEPNQRVLGIAGILDHPSCYMGGPSRLSLRKAERIVDYLRESGVEV